MSELKIIAVDGVAGAGKSSLCKAAAEYLGYEYLSTGILYRTIGFLLQKSYFKLENIELFLDDFNKNFKLNLKEDKVYFKEEEISNLLKFPEISVYASDVAKIPAVRKKLVKLQREIALSSKLGVVVEGRDIGTVIFPEADIKIYMTASLETRAKRRYLETKGIINENSQPDLSEVIDQIKKRDEQDENRAHAPLKQAKDAILFENNGEFDECVNTFVNLIKNKLHTNELHSKTDV